MASRGRRSRIKERAKSKEALVTKLKSNFYDPKKPLGFALKNCTVVKVTPESAAFWNGVKKGWIVKMIDGNQCDTNTVLVMLKGAKKAGKKFRIGFELPAGQQPAKRPASKTKKEGAMPAGAPEAKESVSEELQGEAAQTQGRRGSIRPPRKPSELDMWPGAGGNQARADAVRNAEPTQQPAAPAAGTSALETRIAALEAENAELKKKVAGLELANKQLTEKEIKTRIAMRDMDMMKSSKIATLERALRNFKGKRKPQKAAPKKPLGIIQEDGAMSPRQLGGAKPNKDEMIRDSLPIEQPPAYQASEVSVDVYYRDPGKQNMQDMWKVAKVDLKQGRERGISMSTDLEDALEQGMPFDAGNDTYNPHGHHARTYSDTPTEWTEVTVDVPGTSPIKRDNTFSPHFDRQDSDDRETVDEEYERQKEIEQERFEMPRQNSYGEIPDNETIVSRGDSVIVISEAEIRRREAAAAANPSPAAEAFAKIHSVPTTAVGNAETPAEDEAKEQAPAEAGAAATEEEAPAEAEAPAEEAPATKAEAPAEAAEAPAEAEAA